MRRTPLPAWAHDDGRVRALLVSDDPRIEEAVRAQLAAHAVTEPPVDLAISVRLPPADQLESAACEILVVDTASGATSMDIEAVLASLDEWQRPLAVLLVDDVHEPAPEVAAVEVARSLAGTAALPQAIAHAQDRRTLRRLRRELRTTDARFRQIIHNNADGIVVVDDDGCIEFANPAAEDVFGRPSTELLGREFGYPLVPEETTEIDVLRPGDEPATVEMRVVDAFWDGRPARLASLRDVTARKHLEERLRHQTLHDALTGLPNRTALTDRLEQAIARLRRDPEDNFSLLFCDLDRFKDVNDSLGHAVGDALLAQVAERLTTCVRPGDTVARLGGDEFAILLYGSGDAYAAGQVARRVLAAWSEPIVVGDHEIYTGSSLGIALGSQRYHSPDEVLRDADAAMYRAKQRGRGRYEVFDASLHRAATQRINLGNDLRGAIERDELRVVYQPVIDLATGSCPSVEALVRWQHPQRGLLLPNTFIPIAEDNGMIVQLGYWVIAEACRQAARWQELLGTTEAPAVAVNISRRQFAEPNLVEAVAEVVGGSGADPDALRLELTESVITESIERTALALRRLRSLGVRIDIDDFGTGYSSLSTLHHFPVDALKIDRSFIARLGTPADGDAVVRAIVELAHNLGMQSVAEGVETPEQATILAALGSPLAQGFHFARPVPADVLTQLLAARRGRPLGGPDPLTS